MQVTHQRDHVTHAVIGGHQTIDMAISDSPEFYHILSSTLYTDQILAVVRETLCNAWDAHIEAGKTDTPVEVTVTNEKVIIRDRGFGIRHEDMGPIYGTYGGSTKKANGNVTGGFGLGCKSPWAYTEHFEVISHHLGKRTIYTMSKSSAEIAGKPGITPIASFPTDETGLQVTIPVKNGRDADRFTQLFYRIARNGEMNVLLNGKKVETLPFSTMTNGFMITDADLIENSTRILIRYGNVIYPLMISDEFYQEYIQIEEFLDRAYKRNWRNVSIVFQAAPHTISVTPSREALSMQEHTIATVQSLFSGFLKTINENLEPGCLEVAQEAVNQAWSLNRPAGMLNPKSELAAQVKQTDPGKVIEREILPVIRSYATAVYPQFPSFRFKDVMYRLGSLIDSGFGNTDLLKSYRSELVKMTRRKRVNWHKSSWFNRKVLWPMLRDLKEAKLNPDKLMVNARTNPKYDWHNGSSLYKATNFRLMQLNDYLPFLRNIVILSYNRIDIPVRVGRFPIMRHWLGSEVDSLVYIVPRNSSKAEQAREFFKARGVVLIDLTIRQPWEGIEVTEPTKKEAGPPRPKGLPTITQLLKGNGTIAMNMLDSSLPGYESLTRSETPSIVVRLPRTSADVVIDGFANQGTMDIVKLWGDDIGVATTTPQFEKYTLAGATPLEEFIVEQVINEVRNNPLIQAHHSYDWVRCDNDYYNRAAHSAVYSDAELRQFFGIPDALPEREQRFIRLWEVIRQNWRLQSAHSDIRTLSNEIAKIPFHPDLIELNKAVKSSMVIRKINCDALQRIMEKVDPTRPNSLKAAKQAREIILLALLG